MPPLRLLGILLTMAFALTEIAPSQAEDWLRFRGVNGGGVASDTGVPTTWSDKEGIVWKTSLPGPGTSSPITLGNRIFITCYSGYGVERGRPGERDNLLRHLLCIDATSGKILWTQDVKSSHPEDRFDGFLADHGYASSTPATDGERVYVFFGKSGVLAFDLEGKQLWQTDVGSGSGFNNWGSATSVVLFKDLVIVNADAESEAIVALDKKSGSVRWRAEAKGYKGTWSTPVLADLPNGKAELIVAMPDEVWGIDPADGGLLWFCESGAGRPANPSVLVKDGVVYAVSGGPRGSSSVAIRAGGRDDVSKTHLVWQKNFGSYVPSPVIWKDHLYLVTDRGMALCIKLETGEEVFKERLGEAGSIYASPIAADGKLIAVTRRKGTFVLSASPKFEQLAQNIFESDNTDFNASPVTHNGRLILRSNQAIYCVGLKK